MPQVIAKLAVFSIEFLAVHLHFPIKSSKSAGIGAGTVAVMAEVLGCILWPTMQCSSLPDIHRDHPGAQPQPGCFPSDSTGAPRLQLTLLLCNLLCFVLSLLQLLLQLLSQLGGLAGGGRW